MTLQHITRKQAQDWLDRTTVQRKPRKPAIRRMTIDMNGGQWVHDVAPPILINKVTGAIIDGQHRCLAYLASNESFQLLADVRYVDGDHILVVDTGQPRNLADTLAAAGFENPKNLSAMWNTALYWATGNRSARDWTRTRTVEWIANNPNAVAAAKQAGALKTRTAMMHIPLGVSACLYDIGEYAEGGETVLSFLHDLQTGTLDSDAARRLVRSYLEAKNPRSKRTLGAHQLGLLIARVYVAWLNDESLEKLFARRSSVTELPGWNDWMDTNWKESNDA